MKRLYSIIFCVTVLMVAAHTDYSVADGVSFPPDYLPDGSRPRLWLTESDLSRLQAARAANTSQWQRFSGYIDEISAELPYDGAQFGIPAMALMYKLTGNQNYADRAMRFMDLTSNEPVNGNDSAHGLYGYLALGYDWLYEEISDASKSAYVEKMAHWSDKVWTEDNYEGLAGNALDTDHVIMTGSAHLMMGCALYGDATEAMTLLDRGWWMWARGQGLDPSPGPSEHQWLYAQPARKWVRDAIGGHFYSGWSYFMGTDAVGLCQYWMTLKTACNYDVNTLEPDLAPFWGNALRTTMDLTDPPRQRIHHTGDWQDPNLIAEQAWLNAFLAQACYLADQAGDSDWASYGRGYAGAVPEDYHAGPFLEFFFTDHTRPAKDPYSAELPTVRFCDGTDMLFFRDAWDTSATWGMFSGQGGEPADHQSSDTGSFVLWREDDFLTKDCRVYGPILNGSAFNNITIQNGAAGGSPRMSQYESKASLARHREGNSSPLFAYAMLDGDGQWDEDPYQWEPDVRIDTYRRHFFWSGDHVVVFDRLRTADVGFCQYRLRSLTKPSLNGTTISQLSPNGNQKLLHRTLEPANCAYTLLDETAAWAGVFEDWQIYPEERKWQYVIAPQDSDSVNILNVMQMGPASMSAFDTLEHVTGDDNSGVRIGDWVTVFAAEEVYRADVAYTVASPTAGLNHLVCDLSPGTYQVKENGADLVQLAVKAEDNTAYFVTQASGGSLSVSLSQIPDASTSTPTDTPTMGAKATDTPTNTAIDTATDTPTNEATEAPTSTPTPTVPPPTTGLCVDDGNTSGTEDGTALNPYNTIQEAIDAVAEDGIIRVASGAYNANIRVDNKTVHLYGGYAGATGADYTAGSGGDFSQRNPSTYVTNIQGDGTDSAVTLQNPGSGTLDGFRIIGGTGSNAAAAERYKGGGVYCFGGSETFSNNVIENNNAWHPEAGQDPAWGGGIYCEESWEGPSHFKIVNNVIRGNVAGRGGGIFIHEGAATIQGNIVRDNIANEDHGGGMFIGSRDAEISHNLIAGNEVGRDLGYGWGGGLIVVGGASNATLSYNVVTGNYASDAGSGEFFDEGARAALRHELIYGNLCEGGGHRGLGVLVDGGYYQGTDIGSKITMSNCTVANNSCSGELPGAGLFVEGLSEASVDNCIFWANGGDDLGVANAFCTLTATYTDTQEDYQGEGNISADPLFADPGEGDFHLKSTAGRWSVGTGSFVTDLAHSPCIDAGSPAAAYANETLPNGGRVNMGAYGNTAEASRSEGTAPDPTVTPTVTQTYTVTPTETPTAILTATPTDTVIRNADLNADGEVDDQDLLLLHSQWHQPTITPTQRQSVEVR